MKNIINNIGWDSIIAWIALIVAIVSPIITTIISNCHHSKIKKIEIIEQRGLEIIEHYLAVTSREILTTGISDEYKKCYTLMFLYAPQKIHSDLEKLNDLIYNHDETFPDEKECKKLLYHISKALKYNKIT